MTKAAWRHETVEVRTMADFNQLFPKSKMIRIEKEWYNYVGHGWRWTDEEDDYPKEYDYSTEKIREIAKVKIKRGKPVTLKVLVLNK